MMADSTMTTLRRTTTAAMATSVTAQAVVHRVDVGFLGIEHIYTITACVTSMCTN